MKFGSENKNLLCPSLLLLLALNLNSAIAQKTDTGLTATNEEPEVFTIVEEMPEFPGGQDELLMFLTKNIRYPAEALEKNIQGTVYVSFVVRADGKVSDVKVMRGVNPVLDEEALLVFDRMPLWKPGFQKGNPVAVKYILPVKFSL